MMVSVESNVRIIESIGISIRLNPSKKKQS